LKSCKTIDMEGCGSLRCEAQEYS